MRTRCKLKSKQTPTTGSLSDSSLQRCNEPSAVRARLRSFANVLWVVATTTNVHPSSGNMQLVSARPELTCILEYMYGKCYHNDTRSAVVPHSRWRVLEPRAPVVAGGGLLHGSAGGPHGHFRSKETKGLLGSRGMTSALASDRLPIVQQPSHKTTTTL